jgi:hypothetical protein
MGHRSVAMAILFIKGFGWFATRHPQYLQEWVVASNALHCRQMS